MLKVEKLNFSYDNNSKVSDLNFAIKQGQFTSIIGPNGSGKTTTLNLLLGNLKKESGKILLMDKDIEEFSIEERSKFIGVISQGTSIKFPFTCLEIVMMGRNPFKNRIRGYSNEDYEIAIEAMEATDTLRFSEKLVTQISGGEFQRVMLARAMAQKPKLLFLDEAFSAMDIAYKIKSLNILKGFVEKEGLTIVSVMHDLNLAYTFSDNVIVLKDGKIGGVGNPKTLMTQEFINDIFNVNVYHVKNKGLIVVP